MKEIKLTKGYSTIVDDEDYEYLNQWKWCYNNGYALRHIKIPKSKNISIHRELLNISNISHKITQGDHINGNRLDNRKENLRIVTPLQNGFNRNIYKINKTSKYKGVCFSLQKKKLIIIGKCKQFYLGRFNTEEEAALAYNKKASELFGEYAKLNIIE